MTDEEFAAGMTRHRAAQRDASAITLQLINGDTETTLARVMSMTTAERIACISVLAGDLAIALQHIYGKGEPTTTYLLMKLHELTENH